MNWFIYLKQKDSPDYCSNATYLCKNGGICQNQTTITDANKLVAWTCQCPYGYSGEYCEISKFCIEFYLNLNTLICSFI